MELADHTYHKSDFPLAAVAYYGPDDATASKVVVAILGEDQKIIKSVNWSKQDDDIRLDTEIARKIKEFINAWQIKKIVIAEGILGCPHTPGTDFPPGEDCPFCPFWANKET
jgi:hypothetical protein